ncbi:MAG: nitrate reductase molybdenum cofactor assembly chaperone [Advenella sp.]
MNPYRLLSALLAYPSDDLQQAISQEIIPALPAEDPFGASLMPLLDYLTQTDLIQAQENYVVTFDRTPSHSLHLFEHLHGENRDRGQAMVNLLQEYQAQGFEPIGYELPDYLPLFLEFLSLQENEKAAELLGEAIHVVAYIGGNLRKSESAYAPIFDLLIALSPVEPQELKVVPVRDMDEALEMFGPGADGVEPLLKPGLGNGLHVLNFYSKAASTNSAGEKR